METPFSALVLSEDDLRMLAQPEGIFDNATRLAILSARQDLCEEFDEYLGGIGNPESVAIAVANIEEIAEQYAERRTERALRLIQRDVSVGSAYIALDLLDAR